ncbi:hypothetical protein BTJ48_03275 [Bacillus mycoides]|nr:hypothetical protein BTJ48_03275 [Bacillus mycoides]
MPQVLPETEEGHWLYKTESERAENQKEVVRKVKKWQWY